MRLGRASGWISLAAAGIVLVAGAAGAQDKRPPASAAEIQLSFAPLVERAAPAVVNIYTRKVVRTRQFSPLFDDPFFRRFFGDDFGLGRPRERVQNSLGSGVIVDPDGIIVTNHHVVEGADEITVVLNDRREFEAEIVGSDERTDLAVLRLDGTGGEGLPSLEFRDSDDLEVGDLVLAIGNPFGVGQTVTSGIVSALARTQVGVSDLGFFIQTDAAINPGNSGGALIGMDGRLVGVNTAIFSNSGGSHGIGFAIPANMVRAVIAGIVQGGRLVRPWLGVSGQAVTAEIAASLRLERPGGVLISELHPGSPVAEAGVRPGDVVLAIGDREVANAQALRYRVATLSIGETATLRLWRKGRELEIEVSLIAPPEDPPRDTTELRGQNPLAGAVVVNVSPALAEELGLDDDRPGVMVLETLRGGTGRRLGFRPGDRVLEVNGVTVRSVRELRETLAAENRRWRIAIERSGRVINWVFEG